MSESAVCIPGACSPSCGCGRLTDSAHAMALACLREIICPGLWMEEQFQRTPPGEWLGLRLLPDARGENVSIAWLLRWLDGLEVWTLQQTADGEIRLYARKK